MASKGTNTIIRSPSGNFNSRPTTPQITKVQNSKSPNISDIAIFGQKFGTTAKYSKEPPSGKFGMLPTTKSREKVYRTLLEAEDQDVVKETGNASEISKPSYSSDSHLRDVAARFVKAMSARIVNKIISGDLDLNSPSNTNYSVKVNFCDSPLTEKTICDSPEISLVASKILKLVYEKAIANVIKKSNTVPVTKTTNDTISQVKKSGTNVHTESEPVSMLKNIYRRASVTALKTEEITKIATKKDVTSTTDKAKDSVPVCCSSPTEVAPSSGMVSIGNGNSSATTSLLSGVYRRASIKTDQMLEFVKKDVTASTVSVHKSPLMSSPISASTVKGKNAADDDDNSKKDLPSTESKVNATNSSGVTLETEPSKLTKSKGPSEIESDENLNNKTSTKNTDYLNLISKLPQTQTQNHLQLPLNSPSSLSVPVSPGGGGGSSCKTKKRNSRVSFAADVNTESPKSNMNKVTITSNSTAGMLAQALSLSLGESSTKSPVKSSSDIITSLSYKDSSSESESQVVGIATKVSDSDSIKSSSTSGPMGLSSPKLSGASSWKMSTKQQDTGLKVPLPPGPPQLLPGQIFSESEVRTSNQTLLKDEDNMPIRDHQSNISKAANRNINRNASIESTNTISGRALQELTSDETNQYMDKLLRKISDVNMKNHARVHNHQNHDTASETDSIIIERKSRQQTANKVAIKRAQDEAIQLFKQQCKLPKSLKLLSMDQKVTLEEHHSLPLFKEVCTITGIPDCFLMGFWLKCDSKKCGAIKSVKNMELISAGMQTAPIPSLSLTMSGYRISISFLILRGNGKSKDDHTNGHDDEITHVTKSFYVRPNENYYKCSILIFGAPPQNPWVAQVTIGEKTEKIYLGRGIVWIQEKNLMGPPQDHQSGASLTSRSAVPRINISIGDANIDTTKLKGLELPIKNLSITHFTTVSEEERDVRTGGGRKSLFQALSGLKLRGSKFSRFQIYEKLCSIGPSWREKLTRIADSDQPILRRHRTSKKSAYVIKGEAIDLLLEDDQTEEILSCISSEAAGSNISKYNNQEPTALFNSTGSGDTSHNNLGLTESSDVHNRTSSAMNYSNCNASNVGSNASNNITRRMSVLRKKKSNSRNFTSERKNDSAHCIMQ